MVVASRSKVKKSRNVDIRVDGERLKLVPFFKYLGMTLDSTLNFNLHIAQLIKTVCHKMTLLAKLKEYWNSETALLIYKSMLLPYFDYADVIFCKVNKRDLDKLQKLQNRCLRICKGVDRRFNMHRVHVQSNVPYLNDRRKAHVCNFMYGRKGNKALLNTREIRTRAHDAPVFDVPIPRCEAFKRSVCYQGSSEWNNLPTITRNIDTFIAFKHKQKLNMLQSLNIVHHGNNL